MTVKIVYKQVPAVEKTFNILEFLVRTKKPAGISEIAHALGYHKSTVFNIVYTLADLAILETGPENKFRLGAKLFVLGKEAGSKSEMIRTVHPYLVQIHNQTKLSAFLGILLRDEVVTVDKVDSPQHLKVSSEVGSATPLSAGAVGKVILSGMPEERLEKVLSRLKLERYTVHSCTDMERFRAMIRQAREDGYAFSDEEYIEGIRALAVPLNSYRGQVMMVIYVVGLKSQIRDKDIPLLAGLLKRSAEEINTRLSFM